MEKIEKVTTVIVVLIALLIIIGLGLIVLGFVARGIFEVWSFLGVVEWQNLIQNII